MIKTIRRAATVIAALGVVFAGTLTPLAQADTAGEGPPLTQPEATLRDAVSCDPSVTPSSGKEAVLLVHGIGGQPEGYWDWNYQRALPHEGYGVCTVALPNRGLIDPVISAEYVVYAARYAYERSGRKIALIGHSEGGSLVTWAAKFWPDVAAHAEDVIVLAGAIQGTGLGNTLCATNWCTKAAWRASLDSHFMRAMQNAPMPSSTSMTSIYTTVLDEVVFPQPRASTLPGAANMALQDVCPVRAADHVTILADSVGYALALDALKNPGPAVPSRLDNKLWLCLNPIMPHAVLPSATEVAEIAAALTDGLLIGGDKTSAEPPLPAYAAVYGN
ncbi:esterase/lipase family protein [Streptomyces sp. NPDC050145]|uniref:esterase/lipase family protein n=1 Tax=Streptomyces sp. NPDC050145 TaxID=3365602 RepID=UPI00379A4532